MYSSFLPAVVVEKVETTGGKNGVRQQRVTGKITCGNIYVENQLAGVYAERCGAVGQAGAATPR